MTLEWFDRPSIQSGMSTGKTCSWFIAFYRLVHIFWIVVGWLCRLFIISGVTQGDDLPPFNIRGGNAFPKFLVLVSSFAECATQRDQLD